MAAARAPELDASTFAILRARAEQNAAQRDAALDALTLLVRHVRHVGGYMTSGQQSALWGAEALLAEHGRSTR